MYNNYLVFWIMKGFNFVLPKSIDRMALVLCLLSGVLFIVSCGETAERSETGYLPFKSSKDEGGE